MSYGGGLASAVIITVLGLYSCGMSESVYAHREMTCPPSLHIHICPDLLVADSIPLARDIRASSRQACAITKTKGRV